jgi:hypothetical protein
MGGSMPSMLGRLHHVVLDCPDPRALASFYSTLLGDPITYVSDDWVVVSTSSQASGLAFQLAPDHRPPTWPDGGRDGRVAMVSAADRIRSSAVSAEVLAAGVSN